VNEVLEPYELDTDDWYGKLPFNADKLVDRALDFWGNPTTTSSTRSALRGFAQKALSDADPGYEHDAYPVLIVNALRILFAVSPDYQTC
jgi:hypothetical protein